MSPGGANGGQELGDVAELPAGGCMYYSLAFRVFPGVCICGGGGNGREERPDGHGASATTAMWPAVLRGEADEPIGLH